MQIVIDITEELYQECLDKVVSSVPHYESYELHKAVQNGIPLPKGHGRLIDVNDFLDDIGLEEIPTIIEADRAESEDKE